MESSVLSLARRVMKTQVDLAQLCFREAVAYHPEFEVHIYPKEYPKPHFHMKHDDNAFFAMAIDERLPKQKGTGTQR